jgi:hypothetical protein
MGIKKRGRKRKRERDLKIIICILEVFKYNFLLKTFVDKTLNLISLNKQTFKIIYKGIKQKMRSCFF